MKGIDALDKAVLKRLEGGGFYSGTKLAGDLGVSRATIWKHVRRLEALGLDIVAWPGTGYRLAAPIEWLDEQLILEVLSPRARGLIGTFKCHAVIDSTNSELMRSLALNVPTGSVCLAEYQTAGRGRLGRSWVAPFGSNVCLSLLWRFQEPAEVSGLSLAVGVALIRALSSLGLLGVSLKWPNDLLVGSSKLGGILMEMRGEAHGPSAVVIGIGINHQLSKKMMKGMDQPVIDLHSVFKGAVPGRNVLIGTLLNHLLPLLAEYSNEGLAPYLEEWRSFHAHQGQAATLEVGDLTLIGRIMDVNREGLLLFEDQEGVLKAYASGDVKLRPRDQ